MRAALLIRRMMRFGCRYAADAALVLFFAAVAAFGAPSLVSGVQKTAEALTPDIAAHAAVERHGRTRLPLAGFSIAAGRAPQILFPVESHAWPKWLTGSNALHQGPAIAICIDDLGEDAARTDEALRLPSNVTLAFLPFADATPFLAKQAEARGHEVLAHVPMEALSGADAGPMTLKVGAPDIVARLSWNVARVPGLAGINNHEGSKFTADAAALRPVAKFLAARHLLFFDSRTIGETKVVEVARSEGVPSAGRDIFLDDDASPAAIAQELDDLVTNAKKNGIALAIGHPHEPTLKILAVWLAQDHGVELVPVSEAIRLKTEREELVATN